jgi:hypothetical protein
MTTTTDAERVVAIVWRHDNEEAHAVRFRAGALHQREDQRYDAVALCGAPAPRRTMFTDEVRLRCPACVVEHDSGDPFERGPQLHVITERADGPDLDDLVRLIRYCREHDIRLSPGATSMLAGMGTGQMILRLYSPTVSSIVVVEGQPLPEGHFVGPDGTVYDANREAL